MLDNQVAWIIGGAEGLGKAIATRLAKQGCNIIWKGGEWGVVEKISKS